MADNLKVWNTLKQPPKEALREIMGGRLKGKTDINPQWRYKAMTEQFGMCGVGWWYTIDKQWLEPGPDGQVFAFVNVTVYTNEGPAGIPGVGGSMLIEKESSGLHANDEAYKMATTDALSVALKMLGVGADIYGGLWDGVKYRASGPTSEPQKVGEHFCTVHNTAFYMKGNMKSFAHRIEGTERGWCNEPEKIAEPQKTMEGSAKPDPKDNLLPITEPQIKAIQTILSQKGITDDFARHDKVAKILNIPGTITSFKGLTREQASTVITALGGQA